MGKSLVGATKIEFLIQKQSSGGVLQNRCSLKFCSIHWKITVRVSFYTGAVMQILEKFQKHRFCRTPLDDCFW